MDFRGVFLVNIMVSYYKQIRFEEGIMKATKRFFTAIIVCLFSICIIPLLTDSNAYADETKTAPDTLKATYTCSYNSTGWGSWISDNHNMLRMGSYPTTIKIGLIGQPEGYTGTVLYQVNLSGYGWLDSVENATQTGDVTSNTAPLEAIKVWLNGDLEAAYDIYTKVYIDGQWGAWVKNGEQAGVEGIGKKIDGIRIAVKLKNSGEPEEIAQSTIDPNKPMVALTFDDGPSSNVTNRILTALEAVGGRATFFMVGNRVSGANAACVARMVADGCEVGNHTYTHVYLSKLSTEGIHSSVNQTNAAISAACGVTPKVTRPPGGYHNASTDAALAAVGQSAIMWSVDTLDWKTRNTQSTVNAVLNTVKDGDIVLMHDLYDATAGAAEIIIPELVNRGYQLVTVSEMADARAGGLVPGKAYSSFRK